MSFGFAKQKRSVAYSQGRVGAFDVNRNAKLLTRAAVTGVVAAETAAILGSLI